MSFWSSRRGRILRAGASAAVPMQARTPWQARAIAAAAREVPGVDAVHFSEESLRGSIRLLATLRMFIVWPACLAVLLIAAGVALRPLSVRGSMR